jgi:dihydropteroate synthase
MHMRGEPRTMQHAPHYADVVGEVREFFQERHATLTAAGIDANALCFDPGIGFGKSVAHNLALLRHLADLQLGDRPLLLGVSRKSFIGQVIGSAAIDHREAPTVALTAWGRDAGARIHRVHEVRRNHQALRMTEAILHGISPPPGKTG